MSKSILRILSAVVCIFILFSLTACKDNIEPSITSSEAKMEPITNLNQPYNGSILKITATDIKAVPDRGHNGGITVEVRFEIVNISNQNFFLGPSEFSAYIDDVTADGSTTSDLNNNGEKLHGNIAPGKAAKGYLSVTASKDAKKVEVRVEEIFEKRFATFIFNVPAVTNK